MIKSKVRLLGLLVFIPYINISINSKKYKKMPNSEDSLHEVYYEVENNGLREDFDKQIKRMRNQPKHKYKSASERWDYALYRIKGGKPLDKY